MRLECCAGDGARTGALGCQPATSNFASTAHASGALLVPPDDATRYELARDATLAFLARKEFTAFAVLLIPLVLGFGGLWFFLLIGLHSLEVRPHALRPARPRCARAALLDQRNQRRQQHARPSLPQLPPSEPTLTAHRSPLTPHTSHLTPHTSHLTPHTSPLTAHRSPLTAHRSPRFSLRLAQEEQAHFWQNASIQVLTVCMAYAAVVSLPYRAANAVHLWLSHRSSTVGLISLCLSLA